MRYNSVQTHPKKQDSGIENSTIFPVFKVDSTAMNVSEEFSRFADHYGEYNLIQEQVADKLMAGVPGRPRNMLDIGCGRGALAKRVCWDFTYFLGIDFAPGMLERHPKAENITCIFGDFDNPELYANLQQFRFDRILSASALQWSPDLAHTFRLIRSLGAPVSFAVFTSGTFETLFKTAGLPPLLRSVDEVQATAARYFDADFEVVRYQLAFQSVREMFRYIKRSGVSGKRNVLSYAQTKRLMETYPLDYLEFEVLFIQN